MTRGLAPPSDGNRLLLFDSSEKICKQLFELIESATQRFYIHTFILSADELSNKLIDRLYTKTVEGVDIRFIIDGFSSFHYPQEQLERLKSAGGKTTRFKPIRHVSRFAYLNFRNHRKILSVDGRRAMLGGANLVEYEVTEQPDEDTWVELSLRIDGVAAAQIEAVFASDWEFATGNAIDLSELQAASPSETQWPSEEDATIQLIPIGPDGPAEIIDDLWLTAISRARERIWIVTPYFVPPPLAMRTLVMAIRRGVDVRIIVPEQSDMKPADFARFDYFRDLIDVGAKIFRHPDRVVHAKVVLVDEEVAYIGSANFDFRSFFLNYELVVGIFNENKTKEVGSWYEALQQQCDTGIANDNWRSRFLGTVSRMVAEEL